MKHCCFLQRQLAHFSILFLLWASSVSTLVGQSWPEFRGNDGTGIATGHVFPIENLQQHIEWEVPISGKGWSSPVVSEGKVWLSTATADGKRMSAICVDAASGKVLLERVLHENEQPDFCHPTNSYASPTPVVEPGRVYFHFGKYGTTCLDTATFEQLWQRTDLECDHFRGPGSSPILFQDRLIVAFDGADQQYVVGLSTKDGHTIWKQKREIEYGTKNGDFKKAYGTGSVFQINGQPLLVLPAAVATIAYRPMTGEPVWTVYHEGMNASARPQKTSSGDVLISNGMGKMVSVDPQGSGNVSQTHVKWLISKGVARKSTPLVLEDRFYMINDKGIASCYDPRTGEAIWQERLGGDFSASPVFDGRSIIVCSEAGDVYAIAPGDEFQLLAKTKLGDGFRATPALVGDKLYLRSVSKLYCIHATEEQPAP